MQNFTISYPITVIAVVLKGFLGFMDLKAALESKSRRVGISWKVE